MQKRTRSQQACFETRWIRRLEESRGWLYQLYKDKADTVSPPAERPLSCSFIALLLRLRSVLRELAAVSMVMPNKGASCEPPVGDLRAEGETTIPSCLDRSEGGNENAASRDPRSGEARGKYNHYGGCVGSRSHVGCSLHGLGLEPRKQPCIFST